jgi:uncharacterized membrane protein
VVNPEMTPVAKPISKTFLAFENNRMPRNIIVSIISGFMPKKKAGMIA